MPQSVDTYRAANNLEGVHSIPSRISSQPFVFKGAESYRKTDILNQLKVVRIIIYKDHFNLDEIFLLRSIYVPEFNFEGIITRLKDLDKDRMEIFISELAWHLTRRKYKINDVREWEIRVEATDSFSAHLQDILDSANLDMPFTWILNDGIPTNVEISFDLKDKNHYEFLKLSAINSGNDLWFEGNRVSVGKKGKGIKVNRNDIVFKTLNSDINLSNTANIVNVIGGKDDQAVKLKKTVTEVDSNLLYNIEKTIVNTDIIAQPVLDDIADKHLVNLSNTDPDVTINVSREIVDKYKFESGDTMEVISKDSNQTVKGVYKVIDVNIFNDNKNTEQVEIKLKNNLVDTFVPRFLNTSEIIDILFDKIDNIEVEAIEGFGGGGGESINNGAIRAVLEVPEGENAYPDYILLSGAGIHMSGFVMPKDVDGVINARVEVPDNLDLTPAATIVVRMMPLTGNNEKNVVLQVKASVVADGESFDKSLTSEGINSIAIPDGIYAKFSYSKALTDAVTEGSEIILQIERDGTNGSDTADDILIYEVLLQISRV